MRKQAMYAAGLVAIALTLASCGDAYEQGMEGSKTNPVPITTVAHRGIVGHGYYDDYSYYSFVSPSAHPRIWYTNVIPWHDIDCYVYTEPDFKSAVAGCCPVTVAIRLASGPVPWRYSPHVNAPRHRSLTLLTRR